MSKTKTIFLYIEGGVIQSANIPKGVKVVVHDYDCPGDWEGPNVIEDEDGDMCQLIEFEHTEQ